MGLGTFVPIIGHAIDAFASGVNSAVNANQAKKDRQWKEHMYERQKEDEIAFWKMQNEYDLPSAQLQRMKDAGLNPLLAYGQGGSVAASSGQLNLPSPMSSQPARSDFHTNFGIAMQQAYLLNAQRENIEADTENKVQNSLLAAENAVKTRQEGIEKRNENFTFWERWKLTKESMLAENELKREYAFTEISKRNQIEEECRNLEKQNDYLENQISNNDRLTEVRIKQIEQDIDNSIKMTMSTLRLQDAESRKCIAEAYEARMRAALIGDPEYRKAFKEKELQAVKNMILQGDIDGLEKEMKKRALEMMPNVGDPSYKFKEFLDHWVYPISDIIGRALGSGNDAVNLFKTTKKL